MIEHDIAVGLIPERVQRQLDPRRASELDAHIDDCRECQELERTYLALVAACTNHADHPDNGRLVSYAIDRDSLSAIDREAIATHLAECEDCAAVLAAVTTAELEARAPNVIPLRAGATAGAVPAGRARWRAAMAAAVLVAASGLGGWMASAWRLSSSTTPAWSGASSLVLIAEQQRGHEELPEIKLLAGQTVVPLAVAPALPPDLPPATRYRVALANSQAVHVWELELSGSELSARLGASGVLVFIVPREQLVPGDHRLTLTEMAGRRTVFQGRFRVLGPDPTE